MEKVKIDKKMKFDISLFPSEMKQDHPQFTRVKAKVLYTKFNRNGSYITEDAVNKAINTIFNIPLVGEYLEESDNFGGHGGKVEITDKEIKIIQTTIPYGVVPLDAKLSWEQVTENNGVVRDYLVADGALLWTGRYPELNTILEEGKFGQSMEIEIDEGNFAIIDGQETFKIDSFIFSALCILGVDKGANYDDHVEPCFESASISTYGMHDKDFKEKFNFMLEEFNSNQPSKEIGGQTQVKDKKATEKFELTHRQLSAKLNQDLEKYNFSTKDGQEERKHLYQDHTNTHVIYEDLEEAGRLYQSPYSVDGDSVTIDLTDKTASDISLAPEENISSNHSLTKELEEAQAKIAEFEATLTAKEEEVVETVETLKVKHAEDFEALKAEYSETVKTLKEDLEGLTTKSAEFDAVHAEVVELRNFKREAELAEVKAKFTGKLDEKSLDAILNVSEGKTVDVLEAEIFAEIGKKNFSLTAPATPKQVEILTSQSQPSTDGAYDGLFDQFLTK